jgi:hypothetical protein
MDDQHKPEPPNLDLIGMVQRGRMAHDSQTIPSKVGGVYWIEAKRQADGPAPTPRAGQWVITTRVSEVDALWARVKAATEAGQLGYKSKVSTAPRAGGEKLDSDSRVICVVTADAADQADVERVRLALRALGFDELLYEPLKPDSAT